MDMALFVVTIGVTSGFGIAVGVFVCTISDLVNNLFPLGKIALSDELLTCWDKMRAGEISECELNMQLKRFVVSNCGPKWGSFTADRIKKHITIRRFRSYIFN